MCCLWVVFQDGQVNHLRESLEESQAAYRQAQEAQQHLQADLRQATHRIRVTFTIHVIENN